MGWMKLNETDKTTAHMNQRSMLTSTWYHLSQKLVPYNINY